MPPGEECLELEELQRGTIKTYTTRTGTRLTTVQRTSL